MVQWLEGDVLANGLHLHYAHNDSQKPPVVLLHGFTDNGHCWDHVATALLPDYHVVLLDARGHGRSEGPHQPGDFRTDLLVADAVAVIRELHLSHVALLGHSMGAHTAALIAKNNPELVQALVLEDPPWHNATPPTDTAEANAHMQAWEAHLRESKKLSTEEIAHEVKTNNPAWPEEEILPWVTAQQQFNLDVFSYGLYQTHLEWRETVTHLQVPTLLITADPQRGAIVTPEIAQQALQTMNNGHLIRISGAGHNIRREQYETYISTVRTFLDTHMLQKS